MIGLSNWIKTCHLHYSRVNLVVQFFQCWQLHLETVHELNILSKTAVDLWGSCFGGPSSSVDSSSNSSAKVVFFSSVLIIILVIASCCWLETRSYVQRAGKERWPYLSNKPWYPEIKIRNNWVFQQVNRAISSAVAESLSHPFFILALLHSETLWITI